MGALERFISDAMPTIDQWLIGGPAGVVWGGACLMFAGWLKRARRWRTPYTRKVFHLLIFLTAAGVHAATGLRGVCVFGAAVSAVVLYAVWRGEGHVGYEAMARESDAAHRTRFILIPLFTTAAGGVAANILFGPASIVGYLVTGFGDAVGEPVGTRFGKHRYRAPALGGPPSTRSIEGSAAVFAASLLAATVGLLAMPGDLSPGRTAAVALGIAVAAAVVEALSPHGWDNLTLQLVPSGLAWWWAAG